MHNIHYLYNKKDHYLNTNNGRLNQANVEFEKKTLVFDAIRELATDIVTTKQNYPENDISLVEMELDYVLMERKEFEKYKNLSNIQLTSKDVMVDSIIKNIEKYLNGKSIKWTSMSDSTGNLIIEIKPYE